MNSEAGMAESDTTERLNSTELNFNNFVSQGIGRPNKREREMGELPISGVVKTHAEFID